MWLLCWCLLSALQSKKFWYEPITPNNITHIQGHPHTPFISHLLLLVFISWDAAPQSSSLLFCVCLCVRVCASGAFEDASSTVTALASLPGHQRAAVPRQPPCRPPLCWIIEWSCERWPPAAAAAVGPNRINSSCLHRGGRPENTLLK